MEFRQTFSSDIIVDIIGYRRHGHNELDEPSFTQPIMYKNIRARPSVVTLYGAKLEVIIVSLYLFLFHIQSYSI